MLVGRHARRNVGESAADIEIYMGEQSSSMHPGVENTDGMGHAMQTGTPSKEKAEEPKSKQD